MKTVSQGIDEAIALTLNRHDLDDDEYERLHDGAVEVFDEYVKARIPPTVIFSIEKCSFLDYDTFQYTEAMTDEAQEHLLHEAEAAADEWIEANV